MEPAPVVIFAYNRAEHLEKCIKHLWNNDLFRQSPVYIFCDGYKNSNNKKPVKDVRKLLNNISLPDKTIIKYSEKNKGLAKSVINGIDLVLNNYKSVIVIEDDIIVGEHFLSYANRALNKFYNNKKVGSITGYWYPVDDSRETKSGSFFLPYTSSWSWGTWHDRWKDFREYDFDISKIKTKKISLFKFDLCGSKKFSNILFKQLNQSSSVSSWGILWRWYLFIENKLTLYPENSLVNNIGFDGSGRHHSDEKENSKYTMPNATWKTVDVINFPDKPKLNKQKLKKLKHFYNDEVTNYVRLKSLIKYFIKL